jgi:hypothetical protein
MAVFILQEPKGRIFFAYDKGFAFSITGSEKQICDFDNLEIEVALVGEKRYLISLSYFNSLVRMVLKYFIPEELTRLAPLSLKKLVDVFLPDLKKKMAELNCLPTDPDQNGLVYLNGDIVLASADGIFQICSNGDISHRSSFYCYPSELAAGLYLNDQPLGEKKIQAIITNDAWHYLGGRKIYAPVILGHLGQDYHLTDWENHQSDLAEEKLLCH